MPSVGGYPTLASSLRSAISPILGRIASSDKGEARERNVRTAANITSHFEQWCYTRGFSDTTFEFIAPEEAGSVVAAYAQEIAERKYSTGRTAPHVKTIQNYLRPAVTSIIAKEYCDPRFHRRATDRSGKRLYVPLLDRVFATAKE